MTNPDNGSTAAELSTVRSQVDELTRRITACADRYASTPGSTVAAECYDAERSLIAARRAIERARAALT